MVDKNYVICLDNFAPEEFFGGRGGGGGKSVSMNGPKISNTTGIMKAFLVMLLPLTLTPFIPPLSLHPIIHLHLYPF